LKTEMFPRNLCPLKGKEDLCMEEEGKGVSWYGEKGGDRADQRKKGA